MTTTQRPCLERHPNPAESAAACRLCWLHEHDPRYRTLWGGQPLDRRRALPCRHRGPETGRESCPSCKGHVEVKTFACALHGSCTLARPLDGRACCASCPDHDSDPLPQEEGRIVRNLLYHVYPVRGPVWRWNVQQLLQRISLFNGRRVVAVVVDGRTDTAHDVWHEFGGAVEEFVVKPNQPDRREVETFLELYERVENTDPAQVTFYGHAKGVTSSAWAPGAARLWAETSYELCLDWWPAVLRLLRQYPVVGPFQRTIPGWRAEDSQSQWHFSGSFHWFRNRDLFVKPDWRRINPFHSGVEAYPSLHFGRDEAGCLFHEFARPGEDYLYAERSWRESILPELERWRKEHQEERQP